MFVEARISIKTPEKMSKVNVTNARSKGIIHVNVEPRTSPHKNLMAIATTIRSMDIEHMSADLSPNGHLTSRPKAPNQGNTYDWD